MQNARMKPASLSLQSMPAPQPAPAIRVLVVGADIRYRERAQAVIGELGTVTFAVVAPDDPDDVRWLVRHERADVVVLDATDCEAGVAPVIVALSAVAPRLGVVVVCEHLTAAARELRALPKWGWTRDLRAAVRRAAVEGSPLVRPQRPFSRPAPRAAGADASAPHRRLSPAATPQPPTGG
jgi:hypothetical protein